MIERSAGEGRLIVGMLEGTRIACLQGRSHFYETGDPTLMATPLETLAMLGVSTLLIASTAGSVNAEAFLKTKEEDWGARLRRDETR